MRPWRSWLAGAAAALLASSGSAARPFAVSQPDARKADSKSAVPPRRSGSSTAQATIGGCVPAERLRAQPRRLRAGRPDIPLALREMQTHGGVLVYSVVIGPLGAVTDVRLAKPIDRMEPWPSLDRLWKRAILTWRYKPSVVDGHAVSVCLTAVVTIDVE